MAEVRFDPTREMKFDLGRGQVTISGRAPCLVVPREALLELLDAAGQGAARNFGQQLGIELGRRLAERLGSGIEQASVQSFVEQLGGELAMVGLGALGVERWGHALVITIDGAPSAKAAVALVSAIISGALQRALSRDVSVVELSQIDARLRLLVVSPKTAAKVENWLGSKVAWGEVLTRLHEPGGEA
jgi:hypothetical protein